METQNIIDEMRFQLTGGVLELELDDAALTQVVDQCLRQLQKYIHTPRYLTVDKKPVIDTSEYKISSVQHVYVADSNYGGAATSTGTMGTSDPFYMQMFTFSNGNISTISNYVNNYANYIYANQALNSLGVKSLDYIFSKQENKLYVNSNLMVGKITIEYVPRFEKPEELTDPFWEDALVRMCVATLKQIVGRIRSRFTQSGAIWQQDGGSLLQEGQAEMKELIDYLDKSAGDLRPVN